MDLPFHQRPLRIQSEMLDECGPAGATGPLAAVKFNWQVGNQLARLG
jgi:hypothetical protein